jgi:YD repeat-containing protein
LRPVENGLKRHYIALSEMATNERDTTMPKYDYRCDRNGRTVEVTHPMSDSVSTWGELCALANLENGDTPADSPVHKIISGGFIATGSSSAPASSHTCSAPSCCSGGMCGLND